MDFGNEINNRLNKLKVEREKLLKIKLLNKKFPDLIFNCDRWGEERISSDSVNSIVDNINLNYSCGCCPDAILYVYPYIMINNLKIYSNPYSIPIAEQGYSYSGDKPYLTWRENIRKYNINEKIINLVQEYFNQNPWEEINEEESEDE